MGRSVRFGLTLGALTLVTAAIMAPDDRGEATGGTEVNAIAMPDSGGFDASIVLDAAGNPVISYYSGSDLKVLHCGDPDCLSGNTITLPDTDGTVGQYSSLALDADGHPVISYWHSTEGDLKLLHCNDPDCGGGDESITSPDTTDNVGLATSLALDGSGNPVVAYWDMTHADLKVLHCNDPDCAGGDESITAPDTDGFTGTYASLVLDAAGNPVISYRDGTPVGLNVLHCGNPDCTAGNTIASPVPGGGSFGQENSLALDAAGNPVVSYYDESNGDLKILHCNDPDCLGGDESIATPDISANAGRWTSLVLDGAGNPVVSYIDWFVADLKVLHCGNSTCTSGNQINTPDRAGLLGFHTSIALDANGNPVATYYNSSTGTLKVLHCALASCDPDVDDDRCADASEVQTAPGSETSGGRRDRKNQWDYFNPSKDGLNRVDDILVVVNQYFIDDPHPDYTTQTDRTLLGPNPWNLGPPNGQHRVDDILHAVNQYFHDCTV